MVTSTMDLEVTRMVRLENNGSLKAFCDLEISKQFLIKGLRVIEGRNGLFVSMPRQQGKDAKWYDSVSLLTKETKVEVNRVVLEIYREQAEPRT